MAGAYDIVMSERRGLVEKIIQMMSLYRAKKPMA